MICEIGTILTAAFIAPCMIILPRLAGNYYVTTPIKDLEEHLKSLTIELQLSLITFELACNYSLKAGLARSDFLINTCGLIICKPKDSVDNSESIVMEFIHACIVIWHNPHQQ